MAIMPHQSTGTVYPIVTEAAPVAVDWAPFPPAVAQLTCRIQRAVWLELIPPSQPVTSASTTMCPGALATVTLGTVLQPALVVTCRIGGV